MIYKLSEDAAAAATSNYTSTTPVHLRVRLGACLPSQAAPQLCSIPGCSSRVRRAAYGIGCFVNAGPWKAYQPDPAVLCQSVSRVWDLQWWWLPESRTWVYPELAEPVRNGNPDLRRTAASAPPPAVKESATLRINAALSVGLKASLGSVVSTEFQIGGLQYSDMELSFGPAPPHKYELEPPPAPPGTVGTTPGFQILVVPEVALWVTFAQT